MAKENFVQLVGRVKEVKVDKESNTGYLVLETIRGKRIDTPVVLFYESYVHKLFGVNEGDFVITSGIIGTNEVKRVIVCPDCKKEIVEEGLTTNMTAIEVINIGPNYKLEQFKSISNVVKVLGSLCKDIKMQELASGLKNAQYQVAVNRKLKLESQRRKTDFPFVSSLGDLAEKDYAYMEEGSQCYITGGLQTRDIIRQRECPHCHGNFKTKEPILEICPTRVEYLNNCNCADSDETRKENDVRFAGKVIDITVDQENKVGYLTVELIRRSGRKDYPVILFYETTLRKLDYIKVDDFVLGAGIVTTNELDKVVVCPECHERKVEKTLVTYVVATEAVSIGTNYDIEQFKELSNNVKLLGSLSKDVKMQDLSSGIKNAQYQLKIERRLKIKEQPNATKDYPFISSLGRQAEDDGLHMTEGSECFVNGGLQTREIVKEHDCEKCKAHFKAKETVVEVCPYNTEYLNNCVFPGEDEE